MISNKAFRVLSFIHFSGTDTNYWSVIEDPDLSYFNPQYEGTLHGQWLSLYEGCDAWKVVRDSAIFADFHLISPDGDHIYLYKF